MHKYWVTGRGLSLPRKKNVIRLTDQLDMTLIVSTALMPNQPSNHLFDI